MRPQVDDYLEVLADVGNIDNSPWTARILSVEENGYRVSYDDGDKVYEIPANAIRRNYRGEHGGEVFVVGREKVTQEAMPSLFW